MNSSRDEASLVGITLRVRERLRRDLEETAKERGVSLNQQITDCLEHSRDRRGLLPEVLATAFTDRTAGVALMLARVMEDVGFLHLRPRRRAYDNEDIHWIEDPNACAEAFNAAISVLDAFPSWRAWSRRPGRTSTSFRTAYALVRAVRGPPHQSENLSPNIVREVRALLGPVARRLRPMAASHSRLLSAQAAETASKQLAAAIVELINSNPRAQSPRQVQRVRATMSRVCRVEEPTLDITH